MSTERPHRLLEEFDAVVDWVPSFWNFLLGLNKEDLVVELVQNDVDQGATQTTISFNGDHLVCEGNGRPVDPEGWARLRILQGAGTIAPAKTRRIGIKNHGLKTAFTIGDEIQVSSDGQLITQTLYAGGRGRAPYPGASKKPQSDPQAPLRGCRITVRYRQKSVAPREGEALVLKAIREDDIDGLFLSTCRSAPHQFIGVVSPRSIARYRIVLRHWRLGELVCDFSATRARKIAKNVELFRRQCKVSGTVQPLPPSLREEAARRLFSLRGRLRERVADFFRVKDRYFVEVSWTIDQRGKPERSIGGYRYPIRYPSHQHGRTGHGASYCAPFISDAERHGPAANEDTNDLLYKRCRTLLVDTLAHYAVRKWGSDALRPLVPSPGSSDEKATVRWVLAELSRRDAMPTLKWREAAEVALRTKGGTLRSRRLLGRLKQSRRRQKKYGFVVPVASWAANVIHPALLIACPGSEMQLDPRVDEEIVGLLADGKTKGWCKQFITFDENDGLDVAKGEGNKWFDAPDIEDLRVGGPLIGVAYLDIIDDAIEYGECDKALQEEVRESLRLPDNNRNWTAFEVLYAGVGLPAEVRGLGAPAILHAELIGHRILRRRKWTRTTYTLKHLIDSGKVQQADAQVRRQFWKWIRRKEAEVSVRERQELAQMPIWPDVEGNLWVLSELCDLRSRRVARILGRIVRRPHDEVRRSRLTQVYGKQRSLLRRVPSEGEIGQWIGGRAGRFTYGQAASRATVSELRAFEAELEVLGTARGLAGVLDAIRCELPAVARDGVVRRRRGLVKGSRKVGRLRLLDRYLLRTGGRAGVVDGVAPGLEGPTVDMLADTLLEDNRNFEALHGRLQEFLALTAPGDRYRRELASAPIIPVEGKPRAPRELAFRGSRGDYWGRWKTTLELRALSQDGRKRYLAVGVVSSMPEPETSQEFFAWLEGQRQTVQGEHVGHALRHVLHSNGPVAWATDVGTAWVPVRNVTGIGFVSLARARTGPVYLPDDRDVAKEMIGKSHQVWIVIDRVKGVGEAVLEKLRRLGVKSLRESIGEPMRVLGEGRVEDVPDAFVDGVEVLRRRGFRKTFRKRASDLGIEANLIRGDWQDRVARIEEMKIAEHVTTSYRLRGRVYSIAVDGGFDRATGTFWIGRGKGLGSLYEAIARQLIFKVTALPMHLLTLQRALEIEIEEPSFGIQEAESVEAKNGGIEHPLDDGLEECRSEGERVSRDGIMGHSPRIIDPASNVPRPSRIVRNLDVGTPGGSPPRVGARHTRSVGTRTEDDRSVTSSRLEREHIEQLKQSHYASHCQVCLCARSPQELAPAASYVEWEKVRRRVIEAHHVDLKSVGGAQHAGNLLLLCVVHHDKYGPRFTRSAVTRALRESSRQRILAFAAADGTISKIAGRVAEIRVEDGDEIVEAFFTEYHAEFWLSAVEPERE